MSQSTPEKQLADTLRSELGIECTLPRERRMWLEVGEAQLVNLCEYLKGIGFNHLSAVSVVDLIEEGSYQLTYHLWAYDKKVLLTVKTSIQRDRAVIGSVASVWPSAQIHEREQHELFGVEFAGNPDLSELFLEDYDEIPPFRKDFNWREYVKGSYRETDREKTYLEQ